MTYHAPATQYERDLLGAARARQKRLGIARGVLRYSMTEIRPVPKPEMELYVVQSGVCHTEPCNRPHSSIAREIIAQVAGKHGVGVIQIKQDNRMKHIVAARHEACYRLRNELGLSFPRIATLVGLTCHTSVVHAVRKFEAVRANLQSKPVVAGPNSLGREPRRHASQPALARRSVPLPTTRRNRQ